MKINNLKLDIYVLILVPLHHHSHKNSNIMFIEKDNKKIAANLKTEKERLEQKARDEKNEIIKRLETDDLEEAAYWLTALKGTTATIREIDRLTDLYYTKRGF